jgi:prepilin-type processing-associated H-X9-DG protein
MQSVFLQQVVHSLWNIAWVDGRVAFCAGRSSKSEARNTSTDELSSDANIQQAYKRIEKNDFK